MARRSSSASTPPGPRQTAARPQAPLPPAVAASGPPGAFLVELLIYNGAPFKDHWSYWVRSHQDPDLGVLIHAAGDVRNGFRFEIKRSHDFRATGNLPTKRIPLQWVGKEFFIEKAMFNSGQYKVDQTPVCYFEASAHKVKVPEKTLRAVDDKVTSAPSRLTQRNCQTWIVESADQLVRDRIFGSEVAAYVHSIKQ
ncbi:uncharacterized protein N7506_003200 [Penicillium brevicompactum]|uniref:uncharacterized protein n=1 Tax=Penicillium brevicompactum TaxID=5074 RepID=UPI0025400CDA|nr:uncharacterized protein N7506_003200 [Penicillium brevicompactum]KAJ5343376.1 hypothetical protein N7506_003200 [Penicillium brevicompactum]